MIDGQPHWARNDLSNYVAALGSKSQHLIIKRIQNVQGRSKFYWNTMSFSNQPLLQRSKLNNSALKNNIIQHTGIIQVSSKLDYGRGGYLKVLNLFDPNTIDLD